MKLSIFGSTGGIGSALLDQALKAGNDVTVLVRDPQKLLYADPHLHVVEGDAKDPSSVQEAIPPGTNAVFNALGVRPGEGDVIAQATTHMIEAMRSAGVRRYIGVSASAIYIDRYDPLLLRIAKPILQRVFRAQYDDIRKAEGDLRASTLDWSMIVPPRLNDTDLTGRYRTAVGHNVPGGFSISRKDAAQSMLAIVDKGETVGELVFVAT